MHDLLPLMAQVPLVSPIVFFYICTISYNDQKCKQRPSDIFKLLYVSHSNIELIVTLLDTVAFFCGQAHDNTKSKHSFGERFSRMSNYDFFVIVGMGVVSLEKRRHLSVFGQLLKSITLSIRNHDEQQLNSAPCITKYLICDLSMLYWKFMKIYLLSTGLSTAIRGY